MEQETRRPLDRTASLQRAREAKRLKREQMKDKVARLHEHRWKNKTVWRERLNNRLAQAEAKTEAQPDEVQLPPVDEIKEEAIEGTDKQN